MCIYIHTCEHFFSTTVNRIFLKFSSCIDLAKGNNMFVLYSIILLNSFLDDLLDFSVHISLKINFYFSIFLPPQEWFISTALSSNPLPLCIPALNFIWFLFVCPISLRRFPVFSFIKSIFKNKT